MKIPKACDECHRRKKRCDKLHPICSNCRKWKTPCHILRVTRTSFSSDSACPGQAAVTMSVATLQSQPAVTPTVNPDTHTAYFMDLSSSAQSSTSGTTFDPMSVSTSQFTLDLSQSLNQSHYASSSTGRTRASVSVPFRASTFPRPSDLGASLPTSQPPFRRMSSSAVSPWGSSPNVNASTLIHSDISRYSIQGTQPMAQGAHMFALAQSQPYSMLPTSVSTLLNSSFSTAPSNLIPTTVNPTDISKPTTPVFPIQEQPILSGLTTQSAVVEPPMDPEKRLRQNLSDCFRDCACVSQIPLIHPDLILVKAQTSEFMAYAVYVSSSWYLSKSLIPTQYSSRLALAESHYLQFSSLVQPEATNPTAFTVLGLLLVSRHCYESGRSLTAYSYLIMAVEIARSLQLNNYSSTLERKNELSIEARGRIWWSCYLVDRDIAFLVSMKPLIQDDECLLALPGYDTRYDTVDYSMELRDELKQMALFRSTDWYVAPIEKIHFLARVVLLSKITGNVTKHQYMLRNASSDEGSQNATYRLAALEKSIQDWMTSLPDEYRLLKDPATGSLNRHSSTESLRSPLTSSTQKLVSYLHFWYSGLLVSLYRPFVQDTFAQHGSLQMNNAGLSKCTAACSHFVSRIQFLLQDPELFNYVLPSIDLFVYLVGTIHIYVSKYHPNSQERQKANLLLDLHQLLLDRGSSMSESCANKAALLTNLRECSDPRSLSTPYKGFRNMNVGKFWADLEVLQLTREPSLSSSTVSTSSVVFTDS